jgi:hypothetical protein
LSKGEVIRALNARIRGIQHSRDYLNSQLNKVIISREELLDELEALKKNFDMIQNKRYRAEHELERYKALNDFECNIPDDNLDGCSGNCVKYVNDKFRTCIYLKLKDFEEAER